ncbi:MAG: PhoU domain-containing protein [Candidatus Krumholzibacteriia bacterium]
MGFKSILDIFRQDDWTSELVDRIEEMLDCAAEMLGYVVGVLIHGEPDDDPQGEVYDTDRHINGLVREVRRLLVTRLSVSTDRTQIPTALIFMNAVKDAERIGDYIKNLYEVVGMQPPEPDRELYQHWLQGRSKSIEDLLGLTSMAFAASDDEKAGAVINRARILAREAETAIREIVASDLNTRDAVCLVLVLRFYKRIVAHMSNIATTVVMPVDLLDFHDEPEQMGPRPPREAR